MGHHSQDVSKAPALLGLFRFGMGIVVIPHGFASFFLVAAFRGCFPDLVLAVVGADFFALCLAGDAECCHCSNAASNAAMRPA